MNQLQNPRHPQQATNEANVIDSSKTLAQTSVGRYFSPGIVSRGRLTQFSGSPLGRDLVNPLDLPKQ
jgi:hypothetical protein